MANAHATESATDVAMIITRHLAQANGVQDTEYGFTRSGGNGNAIEVEGQVFCRKWLDIEDPFHWVLPCRPCSTRDTR